jgi:hypothetical protein
MQGDPAPGLGFRSQEINHLTVAYFVVSSLSPSAPLIALTSIQLQMGIILPRKTKGDV